MNRQRYLEKKVWGVEDNDVKVIHLCRSVFRLLIIHRQPIKFQGAGKMKMVR